MAVFINHYRILGFSSHESGSKVSKEQIKKAYRSKALELHPDKRLNDPNAVSAFQQLQASYEILKDEQRRKAFNYVLIIREQKLQRENKRRELEEEVTQLRKKLSDLREEKQRKRKKVMADLKEKEEKYRRGLSSVEERRRAKILREEHERIRGMHGNKTDYAFYDYVTRQLSKN
ncbi:dnaJ subfamily C member 17 [Artemisia annua]|uniref:DnaJ subfamily C member 17 n=1 Tax=Artemisia annua TaxID=35608 RepID=A0A2U1QG59_ARTAN|nr:dnaJ subfamily C member 17 [Artemisia annua]